MSTVKNNILPHSQAKLDLYKDYLSEYLPILGHSIHIDKINLFDIFCGAGVYNDGNFGSPIIAASQILKTIVSFQEKGKKLKPVTLVINDSEKVKVDGVKEYIDNLPLTNCTVEAHNLDADEMFELVLQRLRSFTRRERNLVFIDPYGYSKITKQTIQSLLQNRRTEIILFLPVAQMYRFQNHAQQVIDNNSYEHLRRFTYDFFGIDGEKFVDIFDYINKLSKAFSLDQNFYTASHYIQRDKANYYAVFFIGHHIYGLEKFLEVKWKNDSLGKGFNQKPSETSLFASLIEEYDKALTEETLRKELVNTIKELGIMNNMQVYEYTLRRQFLPSHANTVIKRLILEKKILPYDLKGNVITGKQSLGIKYEEYKTQKPLYFFKLK